MKMYDKLFSIVLGITAASSAGCGDDSPNYTIEELSYEINTANDDSDSDASIEAKLQELDEQNPNASATQKLAHLYPPYPHRQPYAPIRAINAAVRELILEAFRDAADGQLDAELCESLCSIQAYDRFYHSGASVAQATCDAPPANNLELALSCDITLHHAVYSEGQGIAGRRSLGTQHQHEPLMASDARGLWWSQIHCLEKEAVYAFIQLAGELEALGAPASLVTRCLEAAAEEVEHAQQTGALAIQFGGSLAPVPPATTSPTRTLFELALHNVSEGCVRESFAGIEAIWQAERAEPATRPTLRQIAREECGHAALSWDIHAWACSLLTQDEVHALEAARLDAIATLQADLEARASRPWPPELGLPDAPTSLALLHGMNRALSPLANATLA